MTRSLVSRAFRTLAVASLVLTAASCGGSDETRQRNSALPDTTAVFNGMVDIDFTWVPEDLKVSLNMDVDVLAVESYSADGTMVDSASVGPQVPGKPVVAYINLQDGFIREGVTTVKATARILNEDGSEFSSTSVEFEAAVGAVKTSSLEKPEGYGEQGTTDSVPTDSVPAVDPATDTVLRMPRGAVNLVQVIPMPGSIADADMFEISAVVKMAEGASDEATFRVKANLVDEQGVVLEEISEGLSSPESGLDRSKFSTVDTRFGKPLLDRLAGVSAIHFHLESDAKSDEPGYRSAVITSASLKYNGSELLTNPSFEQGETGWTSSVTPWVSCAAGDGITPCTGMDSDAPGVNPGPTDTTPVDTTPVDTTPVDTIPANGEGEPRRISQQEVDCPTSFDPATREISLCESFDEIVLAGFEANGGFADSVRGSGRTITLPENFIGEGRVTAVRLAVASKPEGVDIATFRGEGVLEIGSGSEPRSGLITISPAGNEAMNTAGETYEFEIEFLANGRVDVDWVPETKFAFLTLNGEVFDYYENVLPPSSWDGSSPLAWRAYAIDGFGLPRLVANGVLDKGQRSQVLFADPFFVLDGLSLALIDGNPDVTAEGDPCVGTSPYLITDPNTPSPSARVTLTVERDCENPNGWLGLVVFGDDNENWGAPVFLQVKSTKYSPRIRETIYMASGEYEMLWGTEAFLFGSHSFRVATKSSQTECIYPVVNVDPATKRGRLENCDTGNRRFRVWAYPHGFMWDDEQRSRVPVTDGELNFESVPLTGPMDIYIDIDDTMDGGVVVCFAECDALNGAMPEGVSFSVDTSGFDGTATVTSSAECPTEDSFAAVEYYRKSSPTSWTFANWAPVGRTTLPFPGDYVAQYYCETQEQVITGTMTFTATGSMPNRPANDNVADAAEITPNIGRVRFSTISATSQSGEMGPQTSASRATKFRSVWFKRTLVEGETGLRVGVADGTFVGTVRLLKQGSDGRGIVSESVFFPDNDGPDGVYAGGTPGTTFWVQVLGEWIFDSGDGVLVVNDGEGDEVAVQRSDRPFTEENDTVEFTLEAPPATPTDTTVPADGTTTLTPAEEKYLAGVETAAKTETATVLAPNEGPATIVAREDVTGVQIPVADLYATVTKAGGTVDRTRSLVVRSKGSRPRRVSPTDRSVTVPVGTDTSTISVTGVDTSGKAVSAPIEVKRTAKPLVTVSGGGSDGSGSSLPWLWIALGAVVVLAGGAFAMRGRRTAAPTQE